MLQGTGQPMNEIDRKPFAGVLSNRSDYSELPSPSSKHMQRSPERPQASHNLLDPRRINPYATPKEQLPPRSASQHSFSRTPPNSLKFRHQNTTLSLPQLQTCSPSTRNPTHLSLLTAATTHQSPPINPPSDLSTDVHSLPKL